MDKILEELELYAHKNNVPIILKSTRDVLKLLLAALKPESILEVGTAIGFSSVYMANVLNNKVKIDTIEINPEMVETAWNNVRKAGLEENIRIIEDDAVKVLPALTKQYDFIFMDAAKSRYIDLLPHCVRLVRKEGIIAADNVLYKGMTNGPDFVRHKQRTAVISLRSFIKEVESHPELKTVVLDIGDGITVSVKNQKERK